MTLMFLSISMANGHKIIMLGWSCGHAGQNRIFQPHKSLGTELRFCTTMETDIYSFSFLAFWLSRTRSVFTALSLLQSRKG